MNTTNKSTTFIGHTVAAGILLLTLAWLLAACGPAANARTWPEETIRSAAQAFVDGYNQGDLGDFDSFFVAPDQVVDLTGLARTQGVAHELLAAAQPGSTMQLLALATTSQQPTNPHALASIHYRAKLDLRDGRQIVSTKAVEQTVQLARVRGQWLILGGDEAQVTSAPVQAAAPSAEATVPADSAPATGAAIEMLARSLSIAPAEIQVVSDEALTWPDACLGVTRLGVMCKLGETPGFRIILESGGQRYEYHTDAIGLHIWPGREGPVVASAVAKLAAQEMLGKTLGISASEVRVVSSTMMEWPDACLGVTAPGQSCPPGVTPGHLIALEAQGRQFEFHTNADASFVAPVAAPVSSLLRKP